MKFTKVHGLGNDFVIIEAMGQQQQAAVARYQQLAQQLCDRHFGIGADGLLLVLDSEQADICMRIINSDGSEAEMCGNGIRCFARYVYEHGIVQKQEMKIETLAGIMGPRMLLDEAGAVRAVEVDMGQPILERADIPMTGTGQAIGETIEVGGQAFSVTAVSMGNPHCVIFVDDAERYPVAQWGPKLECCDAFPRKTNVEFVQVLNRQEVRMRVWERGAAITMACGTGACATTVAAILNEKTDRAITVHLDGGDLQIRWDAQSNHLFMTGPATEVFSGEYQEA